jgi:hypothetical protein
MNILLIGATGPMSKIIEYGLKDHGHKIVKMGSTLKSASYCNILNEDSWPDYLDCDLVILNSWMMSPRTKKITQKNINFGLYIAKLCQKNRIRAIFVSSQSAKVNSQSKYGKSKYQVEQDFISKGFQVLKPGLLIDINLDFDTYSATSMLNKFSKYNLGFVIREDINLPICNASSVENCINLMLDNPKIISLDVVDSLAKFNNLIFNRKNKYTFKVSRVLVSNIINRCLPNLGFLGLIKDKWLSLNDASF